MQQLALNKLNTVEIHDKHFHDLNWVKEKTAFRIKALEVSVHFMLV